MSTGPVKKTISYFVGAGAECSYGLPDGGKFALDLFRYDSSKDKESFRKKRDSVDCTSAYANKWLPRDYRTKSITTFSKSSYEQLIKGSLEYKSADIKEFFNTFDEVVYGIAQGFSKKGIDIAAIIEKELGMHIGDRMYGHDIALIDELSELNTFFGSEWLGALLTLYQNASLDIDSKKHLRHVIKSLFEILIGCESENLVRRINENVFKKSIDTIDIFDDINGILELDYRNTGVGALEFVIEYGSINLDASKTISEQIKDFTAAILEKLLSNILNYQELIDSNWHYLYSPGINWGRFTKMCIFLYTAQRYITDIAAKCKTSILKGDGYYHDILKLDSKYTRKSVGTTNYNTFARDILGGSVYHLNGCVEDMYDPYTNRIVDKSNHITVPFMFTQSGIKPLTSVSISRRYVELYDAFKNSDYIAIIGFGFQSDDGHINGIFRDLVEVEGKELFILCYVTKTESESKLKRQYTEKLRMQDGSKLHIIPVDGERKIAGTDQMWYEGIC